MTDLDDRLLNIKEMLEKHVLKDSLQSYDPYDIWQTALGSFVKRHYYAHPLLLLPLAGMLSVYDLCLNNNLRLGYKKKDYPIVLAFSSLILSNLYRLDPQKEYLQQQERFFERLLELASPSCSGLGWGLPFPNQIAADLRYESATPYSTMTPYIMDACVTYHKINPSDKTESIIKRGLRFFLEDVKVIYEDDETLATSYTNMADRVVNNAVSYTMYMYSLLYPWANSVEQKVIAHRIPKMYNFIRKNQNKDGSWLYAPNQNSFIDCFHSCIVLKNLIKTNQIIPLDSAAEVIRAGYEYIKNEFYVKKDGLFKRFTVKNKPGIIKYDLYDNSEVLNLAFLLKDNSLSAKLTERIVDTFCTKNEDIFSVVTFFNLRRNKNMLRWAVMPFLYALSNQLLDQARQ